MFDEGAYKKLKENKYYKIFAFNCFLGVFICFTILMLFIILLLYLMCGKAGYQYNPACCLELYIPAYIIGAAALMAAVGLSLKKKPYLCSIGIIKSVEGSKAAVDVNGTEVRGTSFEHFVKSAKLSSYAAGDEVIIYSSAKKCGRPLFFKI